MLVQRGIAIIPDGQTTVNVTLDTPVDITKAWWLAQSIYNGNGEPAYRQFTTEFTNPSGGLYSQITFTRTAANDPTSSGLSIEIGWQVISGDEFTVQHGQTALSGTSATPSISTVDLSKAFIITSNDSTITGSWADPVATMVRAHISSTTAISLERESSSGTTNVSWQVIEWEGASVQRASGITIPDGETEATDTISPVNIGNIVILPSHTSTNGAITGNTSSNQVQIYSSLTNSTTIRFQRATSNTNELTINYQVIELPELRVKRYSDFAYYNTPNINVSIDDVEENETILFGGSMGYQGADVNQYDPGNAEFRRVTWYITHLTSPNNVLVKRLQDDETATSVKGNVCANFFTVTPLQPVDTPSIMSFGGF